jgi:small-conductance mechanosensitive channel/CRP-like cAMP-binding protein
VTDLTSESWFWWTVALVIGLPILLIALTELQAALVRRHSALAAPVALLRNFALPAGAVLVLFTKVWELDGEATWVRILATVFGFLVIVLLLSALNVLLFKQAEVGSWRERMPSIFIDLVRLLLVITGLALVFAWVWDANVAGLFAALGVTSIVLGFALQNAVGSIISGLLLLFEQPFKLGDWLEAEGERGRIVEVNWRSVHIETEEGVRIIPNATLAEGTFTNLSQPAGDHQVIVSSTFAVGDPPDVVLRVLERVGLDVPVIGIEPQVRALMTEPRTYTTTIAIRSPADAEEATATFSRWLWYASRRAGLHLDGGAATWSTPEAVTAALRDLAPALNMPDEAVEAAAAGMSLERYGNGEVVQYEGSIPDGMRFVRRGRLAMRVTVPGHGTVQLDEILPGDYIGITTLTKETLTPAAIAVEELEVLYAPQAVIEDLVRATPLLARDLGRQLDLRRERQRELITARHAGGSADGVLVIADGRRIHT